MIMIDLKYEFVAEKEAIKYAKQIKDGCKISFADGFKYAMKIVNKNSKLSLPSNDEIDEVLNDMCLYATEESEEDNACRNGAKKIIEHIRTKGNVCI